MSRVNYWYQGALVWSYFRSVKEALKLTWWNRATKGAWICQSTTVARVSTSQEFHGSFYLLFPSIAIEWQIIQHALKVLLRSKILFSFLFGFWNYNAQVVILPNINFTLKLSVISWLGNVCMQQKYWVRVEVTSQTQPKHHKYGCFTIQKGAKFKRRFSIKK